jgi:alkylation response protein AidB-like acyl-CoA dehydrogenase
MMQTATRQVMSEDLYQRCAQRAPVYDRENRFFSEDFEELRAAGYLLMAVPSDLGGAGLTLPQVCQEQRRLAYHAPATALALNMHVYWTGMAADLRSAGDRSLEWILREAAAGEVFAAGHAESGNDIPVLLSTTRAERVDGGYRFYGHKHFGSLSPVWTRLGLHGMDTSDPTAPKIVHAFMPRDTPGYRIEETWDTMGMRATASNDTILEGCFVPDRYIGRVVPAGAAGLDAFVGTTFVWALMGFANVYCGLARYAMDRTLATVKTKKSIAITRTMAYHPEVQHAVAEMVIELETIEAVIERAARDWSENRDPARTGELLVRVVAAKCRAVESAWKVVDTALELAGGFGIFRAAGIERLFRDARLGRIHPTNSFLSHELLAKLTLGINPDEQPRWG